jgi:DNA polymerase-4
VGPATRRRLDRLGVHTIGELAAIPEAALVAALGDAHGRHLYALARNDDGRPVETERPVKSIGHEETFAHDLADHADLARELVRMSERVAMRLRASGKAARTVQLKVRFGDFRTITRSHTLPEPTDLARDIQDEVRALLDGVDCTPGVRLLGVSAHQLVDGDAVQESLPFATHPSGGGHHPNQRALEAALDGVRARFGDDAVGPATLLDQAGVRLGRRGTRWGPNG